MDIAKIRKKAKEKERETQRHGEVEEKRGSGLPERPAEETDNAVQEVPEQTGDGTGEDLKEGSEPLPGPPETGEAAVPPDEKMEELPEPGALSEEDAGNVLELLTFSIAEKEFAFSIADLEEIIPYQGITFVPLLPGYVSGVMSLRGKIIPVIDLRARFGLGQNPHNSSSSVSAATNGKGKILILSGPKGLIGATVERIKGVVRCPENSVLAPPAHLTEEERKFIDGVVVQEKRFISIVRFGDAMNIEVG
ncbi:MAG: chemotaxis protein CheW [Candidatus Sulfobium sp.]